MAHLRSARLREVLGAEVDDLAYDDIVGLVASNVAESFDLDFKRDSYVSSDGGKKALAIDVAALANAAGGVIVLGVDEDDQARASAAPGVDTSDDEVRRLVQTVAAGVAPLPPFDVRAIPGRDGRPGFIAIAVARSALAPHAVVVHDTLRYPLRTGTTTRYLNEPEVAAAYRDRWTSASARLERADTVEADVVERLDGDSPWVVVSLVPELPGHFDVTAASYRAFEREVRDRSIHPLAGGGAAFHQVDVGFERLTANGSLRVDGPDKGISAALHTDGSGVVAAQCWDIRRGVQPPDPSHTIAEESLAALLAGSVQFLALHARDRAQTSGTALVRAFIVTATSVDETYLGHARQGFPVTNGRSITGRQSPVATTYALVDAAAAGRAELLVAVRRLLVGLGHAFGLPELPQFTDAGALRWPYWSHHFRPAAKQWADSHGVEIDESVADP
ncbi:helix-turn-helix domain-containing protein [Cellulomonas fimi]|uniref:AlbA family DNA-binding domain-containing protein n=1 Tax=Cellulomonas fimi TaxID=1708 RepID=UPI00235831D8|nr:ATP-binding protein [Cellulomonas fimi]